VLSKTKAIIDEVHPMRTITVALVSALALTVPAFAQHQNPSGIGGVIQNLDRALNPNDQSNNPSDRDRYENEGRYQNQYSGSSIPPIRSRSDYDREKARLDRLQSQLNDAQRQLSREYDELDRARDVR
jgi:hypothetical protein